MNVKENEAGNLLPMTVMEGVTVNVLPNQAHEYLMTTQEVSVGYGVSDYTLRRHKMEHSSELIEGKHYVIAVQIMNGSKLVRPNAVLWTKRGIVRLGFFIKSERAKLFRDWAEELIISVINQQSAANNVLPAKRNHNRLTQERIIDIMSDVCQIEDKELRMSITSKLLGKEVGHGTL